MRNVQSCTTFLTRCKTLFRMEKWEVHGQKKYIYGIQTINFEKFSTCICVECILRATIRMSCCILSVIYSRACSSDRCNVFDIFGWIHMPFHILHKGRLFESRPTLFTLKKLKIRPPGTPQTWFNDKIFRS